jgi:hypothetical protein
VETLRRRVVWIAALYAVCCLGLHIVIAVARPGPLPNSVIAILFFLTMGVAAAAVLTLMKLPRRGKNGPSPRRHIAALAVAALAFGFWPMLAGSGVPNTGFNPLVDSGVPSGPPGDRSLNDHGRRVRGLTEEEFQRAKAWQTVIWTGLMASFSGMTCAGALYFQQARRHLAF